MYDLAETATDGQPARLCVAVLRPCTIRAGCCAVARPSRNGSRTSRWLLARQREGRVLGDRAVSDQAFGCMPGRDYRKVGPASADPLSTRRATVSLSYPSSPRMARLCSPSAGTAPIPSGTTPWPSGTRSTRCFRAGGRGRTGCADAAPASTCSDARGRISSLTSRPSRLAPVLTDRSEPPQMPLNDLALRVKEEAGVLHGISRLWRMERPDPRLAVHPTADFGPRLSSSWRVPCRCPLRPAVLDCDGQVEPRWIASAIGITVPPTGGQPPAWAARSPRCERGLRP